MITNYTKSGLFSLLCVFFIRSQQFIPSFQEGNELCGGTSRLIRICYLRQYITMAFLWMTPAPKCFAFQFFFGSLHQVRTRGYVFSVFLYDFASVAISAYFKGIAPFRGSPAINVIRFFFTMDYFGFHLNLPNQQRETQYRGTNLNRDQI